MDSLITIDKETAENEFERLCKSWHIEIDMAGEDEVAKAAQGGRDKIITALMKGVLIVKTQGGDEDGYKLRLQHNLTESLDENTKTLSYRFIRAGDMIAMDEFKESQTFKRMIALVSAISGTGAPAIRNMMSKDLILGQCVGGLFLAA